MSKMSVESCECCENCEYCECVMSVVRNECQEWDKAVKISNV